MPGQDRTGPLGQGPLTGRGFGPCGRGFRRGFGRALQLSNSEEKKVLESELKEIEADKKDIEKRLKELK